MVIQEHSLVQTELQLEEVTGGFQECIPNLNRNAK